MASSYHFQIEDHFSSRVSVLPSGEVYKKADRFEISWTMYLAPKLIVEVRDDGFVLQTLQGPTLATAGTARPYLYLKAAMTLGQLHRCACSVAAPPLPAPTSWYDSLARAWTGDRWPVPEKELILTAASELMCALVAVEKDGIFLDANPNNWIVVGNNPIAIDFGHVARASYLSDFSQLLDHSPVQIDLNYILAAWNSGFGAKESDQVDFGALQRYFPLVRIFSALARAPYHPPRQRLAWYIAAIERCQHYGFSTMSSALNTAINLIVKVNTNNAV